MIPSSVVEELAERLVSAARKRHEAGQEIVKGMDVEQFLKIVARIGALTVELSKEGMDVAHVGMGLDYYSRAVRITLEEDRKMREAVPAGSA